MDNYIENNITEIISHTTGKDTIVKSSTFINLPGCIYAASLGSCIIGWSVFEKSHTKNTIFIGAATNIVYEGNCVIECSGKGAEIVKKYGYVARILGNSIFSTYNFYTRCESIDYMEYLYADNLGHYSTNYSLNIDESCGGPLLRGNIELITKMIYSYRCESAIQLDMYNSPGKTNASMFVFINCTSDAEHGSDLSCWNIKDNTVISDSSFVGNMKKNDCRIYGCNVAFYRFYFSRNTFQYWCLNSGTAANVECVLNEPEVKISLGIFRKGCFGQLDSDCTIQANKQNLSIMILSMLIVNNESK